MFKCFIRKYLKRILLPVFNEIVNDQIIAEQLEKTRQVSTDTEVILSKSCRIVNRIGDPSLIKIGFGTVVSGEIMIMGYGGNVTIGSNCYIGEYSRIWSGESITIGDNVLISHNVNIIDTNSHQIDYIERAEAFKDLLKNGPSKEKRNVESKPIIIEDNVWINFNVVILKGVTIGRGSIISPNSLVVKDVPAFHIVGGIPSKILKKI